jgi:hypothetical protein
MNPATGTDLRTRLDTIARELGFGEVAVACGLKGSTRAGWRCPHCQTEGSIRERSDHLGGRCTMTDCAKGYDLAGLVMTARGISALQAATFLERILEEKRAAGNPKAPGLFDQSAGGQT